MSSFKTGSSHKKLQPGTVIIGENGLPVDTIATISGSYQILKNNTTTLAYAAGVVTVNAAVDLTTVRGHKSRYTGRLILQTVDGSFYFIDKPTVDPLAKTFNIYNDEKSTSVPVSIDLSAGWIIAEAEIVNRLATSAAAKIDSVEFRDMQFQLDLDGDPVSIQDDDGHKLDINPDGSVNVINASQLVPEKYDEIEVTTKNINGDPTQVVYRLALSVVAVLNITYDIDGDLQKVKRL